MKTLTKDEVLKIGSFDGGGRFYLHRDFETKTSRAVRAPSRTWPFSIYKHCFTQKYFKSLSDAQKQKLETLLEEEQATKCDLEKHVI